MSVGLTIRRGSVRVKIFASKSGKYVRHEIRWTDHHGRRRRLKRSKLSEARKEAERLADDLARGHHHSELTLADLASFRAGIVNLFGTGKTLELATAEYAEMKRIEPETHPAEMAKYWRENHRSGSVPLTVSAAVARLLETKTQQGISANWHRSLRSQLERFARDHQLDIARLKAADVRQWVYALAIGPRSRNNHLDCVKLLFSLAELRGHRERQAILDIAPITVPESKNALWTPDEFQRLLHAAPAHLLPVLVLGGFAKMRSSEIMRVTADNLRLKEKRVMLHAGQTKTRRWRIVPLPGCAVAWLRSCALPDAGPLWPWGENKFHGDLRALAAGIGVTWRRNALRNSAVTYDQICSPDVARVAREAGNSPGVLENEYFALNGVTRKQARAWFAIRPPAKARVIVPLRGQTESPNRPLYENHPGKQAGSGKR